MSSPTVSVIVPVYNTAEYLPCCLDSLINQTYPHIEILCVDDGSTDNSWQILQEYAAKDSRIKIFHQENAGVSAARNKALDHATGEYLSFVDSDDWLEADTFEICTSCFDNEIMMVCFSMSIDLDYPLKDSILYNCCPDNIYGKRRVDADFILRAPVSPTNKVIRRSLFTLYNLRFPNGITHAEDCVIGYHLYAAQKEMQVYALNNTFYHYQRRADSAMSELRKKSKAGIQHIHALGVIYSFYTRHPYSTVFKQAYPIIFWSFANKALETTPNSMHDFVVSEIKRLANLQSVQPVGYLENRLRHISSFEKNFHWFRGCSECFGFKGKSIWSITCQPTEKQYRFMGCLVYRCKYPVLQNLG